MQLLQWQTKGPNNWIKCSVFHQHHLDYSCEPFSKWWKSDDNLCSLNHTSNYSHLSISSTMSRNFIPTFVYQRKRHHTDSIAIPPILQSASTKPTDGCNSVISSEGLSLTTPEHVISVSDHPMNAAKSLGVSPVQCNVAAKRRINGFHAGEEVGYEKAQATGMDRVLNVCVNDNCSSSRSNLEHSSPSLKVDVDDTGECSSSGALIVEEAPKDICERDICISILRRWELLDKKYVKNDRASTGETGVSIDNYCSKPCKVCERKDSTRNMLICDKCGDAFHCSCCNPCVKILPAGEWLCSSCLKKKRKILTDKSISSSVNRHPASDTELGSLEFMFQDTEPFMSNVRIGDKFQANVPEWRGPDNEVCDLPGDRLQMDPSNNNNMPERCGSVKPVKLSSIGNWIQCREVIYGIGDGSDGAVCGKWRRAPLFEVQTDDWECFRCVLWDPTHADCAAPQEVDTEEVMKQLKYMEMLRPRLAAKRRKVETAGIYVSSN